MSTVNTSTSTSIIKDIFDAAITMPEGSKIPITFGSESQRESFRVRFYNEKQRYTENFGAAQADTIICSKYTDSETNTYSLIITKTRPMSTPYIISPDGSMTPILPSSRDASASTSTSFTPPLETPVDFGSGPETPEQRRQRLMNVTPNVTICQDQDQDPKSNEE
jgi:hypothetical protein